MAIQDAYTEYTVKRKKRNTKRFDGYLEREKVIHDIADEDKVCTCCQGDMHCIGSDVTEKLEFVPASAKVIEHHRLKYACRTCEKHNAQTPVKQAPPVPSILPKSFATPSLLAHIITAKYQYGLPLYRQETLFKQLGIHLSRQTMADWMIKVSHLFKPITVDAWQRILLQQETLRTDETTLQVVNDDNQKSYMWLYNCGVDSPEGKLKGSDIPNIVLFDYQPTRAGIHPKTFLDGYTGYLNVDGYQGYQQTDAKLVVCLAHIRRKFIEAKQAQGKNAKTGKADMALSLIQKLYRIETRIKQKSIDERYHIRKQQSIPIIETFKTWLDKSSLSVLPESYLGKAIQYARNHWDKFIRYCEDGRIDIDNNRSERAIKPFVIGRKNWLISQTANGASASAVLYSIIETAKANGLKPYDYLMHIMQKIIEDDAKSDKLLPWEIKLE